MKRPLAALAVIIGLLVIVPSPAIAITDGTPDTSNRFPFVGLLAFRDADGEYMHRCSGTLLTPTIVLTASHCTDGTSIVHAYFSFQVPDDFRENPVGVLGTPHTNPLYNQGGTCFGDSGGPHFWEDSLILVSVTSWGDAICHSLDMTQRTDIPSVLDWLREEFGVVSPA